MRHRTLAPLFLIIAAAAINAAPSTARAEDKLAIAVSIAPQAYLVERIGGEHVGVQVLVGPGQSPHAYDPTAKDLARLSKARVYFSIGVEFEQAVLPRLARMFPKMEMVDTRAGIRMRTMETSCVHHDHGAHDTCDHGHAHDHESGPARRPDPHVWLSPELARTQARTICETLVRIDPERAALYRRNAARFDADVKVLQAELQIALAPLKGREVFVFHPAFGYFCDEFELKQVPVEIEGKTPTARQLATLIERAKAQDVHAIFVQPQFSTKAAEAVAKAIDGAVVPLDPLARNWSANLRDMAEKITAALSRDEEKTE